MTYAHYFNSLQNDDHNIFTIYCNITKIIKIIIIKTNTASRIGN